MFIFRKSMFFIFIFHSISCYANNHEILCIDDVSYYDDILMRIYLHNARGYFVQQYKNIKVSHDLQDCFSKLKDGDELHIVTHGTTGSFWWGDGDSNYTGFGSGSSLFPVSTGKVNNVTIYFHSCFSNAKEENDSSIVEKLQQVFNGLGQGNVVKGYSNLVNFNVNYAPSDIKASSDEEKKEIEDKWERVKTILENDESWADNIPNENQKTAIKELIKGEIGGTKLEGIDFTLTYALNPQIIDQKIKQEIEVIEEVGDFCTCEECVGTMSGSDINIILLVELNSFYSIEKEGNILLSWNTSSEIDTVGFLLWRSVDNGKGFKDNSIFTLDELPNNQLIAIPIANGLSKLITAKGNEREETTYSYVDTSVQEENMTFYYLVEDVDTSGLETLHCSKIQAVKIGQGPAIDLKTAKKYCRSQCDKSMDSPIICK